MSTPLAASSSPTKFIGFLPAIAEKLINEDEQQRARILSELHDIPPSHYLEAYFDELKDFSRPRTEDTIIEGACRFAFFTNLDGPKRAKYYGSELKGLHYVDSFTELWNSHYPTVRLTAAHMDVKRVCPPSWSSVKGDSGWTLTYRGEGTTSQALNELLLGPTVLDCGLWTEMAEWNKIRWMLGDPEVDLKFKFRKGEFYLTQRCFTPRGNLLYRFYDPVEEKHRIRVRLVFNHATYSYKHPGGMARLFHALEVDGRCMIFSPGAFSHILTPVELDQLLKELYNEPRTIADLEELYVRRQFDSTLPEELETYEATKLTDDEWEKSFPERLRKAWGRHLGFNLSSLVSYIENPLAVDDASEQHIECNEILPKIYYSS
ncbi:hypothetical protein LTR84_011959 [Exophiala bonariae]|uniref:HNH nuclease domain-containing protein n=1 Tax=Exophiala bonariae TaxID=1690606 RepID=A0AAV9MS14_9EURO|nr:hypothetical protein LTR84_011959 [Exophiala bonariae]